MTAIVKLKTDIVKLGLKYFNSKKYATRCGRKHLELLKELDLIVFAYNNGNCNKELTTKMKLIYEKYGLTM